ncbi:MAG TPA: hypothetical protein VLE44_02365 [Candidatus Saccharimonadales bacterium]|nr:hypothetical protein [Candidatus Saccharimonadales bacterium]
MEERKIGQGSGVNIDFDNKNQMIEAGLTFMNKRLGELRHFGFGLSKQNTNSEQYRVFLAFYFLEGRLAELHGEFKEQLVLVRQRGLNDSELFDVEVRMVNNFLVGAEQFVSDVEVG